jgi:poly-gamma-glutamate capsule biosynthesis protein CapA/YwtB (metallophosphatase superfamily)
MLRFSSFVVALVVVVAGGLGGVGAFLFVDGDRGATPAEADDDLAVAAVTTVSTTTTTTTTSTTTTTTTTTTTVPPRTATLLFTGDLLPHAPVLRAAAGYAEEGGWDFTPMYARVRPMIEAADVAICHMETPISADDTNIRGYPFFNAPRAFAEAVFEVGYDGCSTASNHSMDEGRDGVSDTIEAFTEIGLTQDGMARTEAEDQAPTIYDAGGIAVAHISAAYGLNGFTLPADEQYLVELIDADAIVAEARAAREAGAEFVVVSLHWGVEYRHDPTNAQIEVLEAILPTPEVNLVIGHHAHVVQPIDDVKGEWVVYGLGNFLSNQSGACCATAAQDGVIVEVDLVEPVPGIIEVDEVRYTPTWVDRSDYTILPVAAALADGELEALHGELRRSWARTTEVIEALSSSPSLTVSLEPPAEG